MERAIVAVFDEHHQAQDAHDALLREGFSSGNVRITSGGDAQTATTKGERSEHDESFTGKIANFFGFGKDDSETYSEAVRRGSCVLIADVATEQEGERAQVIMGQHNPVDIDERTAEWRESGWRGSETGAQTAGEEVVPVVEEELRVGKRETQRGGVRVRSHSYEKPVEANVELREERSTVERRPADRPATEADVANAEATVETRDTVEEAVVAKDARVVEEVVVGKEVSDKTETISDSVRRTDVDVENVEGEETTAFDRQRETRTSTRTSK